MFFKPVIFAATAAAFVILPEITEHDEGIFKALPILNDVASYDLNREAGFAQGISVPCTQCSGKDASLRFDFKASDSTLSLNGFELYPDADPWSGDLSASVVEGSGISNDPKLGYSLAVYPKAKSPEDMMELIEIEIKVIEIGNEFVEGVPSVKVELVKEPSGNVFIGKVDVEKPPEPEPEDSRCTSMWCKTQELFESAWDRVKSMGGCHKQADQAVDEMGDEPAFDFEDFEDEYYFPETYEDTEMEVDDWADLLADVASQVVMPVLIGVTAGVAAAFLAMCLGNIALAICKAGRKKRSQKASLHDRKATADVSASSEEKAHLMESE